MFPTAPLPLRRARPESAGGLAVSRIGLGCMGMSEFYGESDDARSREVIAAAIDHGIRFFDTADVYGSGHNETLLGHALRDHPARSEIVLATKGGILRDPADPARRGVDTSPEYILQAIDRSLDRLQTPIDLYYLHRVAGDGQRIEETMAALAQAIKAGKIGAVGLSEVSAPLLARADASLREATGGAQGIAALQTEYSLMTRHIERDGVAAMCRDLGVLLVAYSPMGRGLLTGPAFDPATLSEQDFRRNLPRFSGDNLAHNRRMIEALNALARDQDITPAQLALAWVMARGPNVVPIPGTRSPARLTENIRACQITLSPETLTALDAVFAPEAVAGTRYSADAMRAYGFAT